MAKKLFPKLIQITDARVNAMRRHDLVSGSGANRRKKCLEVELGARGIEKLEAPAWFLRMVKRGATPEEVLEELRTRVMKGGDIHTAKLIVNAIGRLPSGGGLLKAAFTQERVFELQKVKARRNRYARR